MKNFLGNGQESKEQNYFSQYRLCKNMTFQ